MAFWLAGQRDGQEAEWIQRFDPRFWTVDFPRPMMASVVTTAADALRIELEFHHANALAGLIWDSVDRFDHPLLAYDTDRDYSRTTLSFRWRSGGVVAPSPAGGGWVGVGGFSSHAAESRHSVSRNVSRKKPKWPTARSPRSPGESRRWTSSARGTASTNARTAGSGPKSTSSVKL